MYAGMSARTCSILRLQKPAPDLLYPSSEKEHRKRVCWTSYCLDKMTSSEMGLPPSFQSKQIEIEYPSDESTCFEENENFFEADFFRARIQVTMMKAEADIFIDSWQSTRDDILEIERRAGPILAKLESLMKNLPGYMLFNCDLGLPDEMARLPTMRSLASLYLRYNQVGLYVCYEIAKPVKTNKRLRLSALSSFFGLFF